MRVIWMALALILLWTSRAAAQSNAPALTPPKITSSETVPYPDAGQGEAVVVLELLVGVSGAVQETKVVDGAEPFVTAAREAAAAWTFVPARRGEVNVAARVRMRIEFHPPITTPSPAPSAPSPTPPPLKNSTPGAPPSAPPAPSSAIEEVQVHGMRPEAGKTTVGGSEVRQVPGAFGDAFRMMEALPGVTPIMSGLPFFFVRGAPPGNTGYFIDGVRVPLLYHLAAGPSVIHPALVDHVDFYPGGYPAQYGRFAGGILAGYTRAPATAFHADWNLRVLDAGALVETPFAGGRGTAMVGGRYGYPGLVLPLFAPDARLSYWDYQARLAWKLNDRDTVSAFWFGSYDYLAEVNTSPDTGERQTEQLFSTMFHRLDLRFDRRLENAGNFRLAATLGTDKSGADNGDATSKILGARAQFEQRLSQDVRVRMGADAFLEHFDLFAANGNPNRTGDARNVLYAPRNDVTFGAYADATWRISSRVEMVPGLRVDLFHSRRIDSTSPTFVDDPAATAVGVDPRLALRVLLAPKVTWVSTFGISHQPPSLVVPVPGVGLAKLGDGLQTSVQASQGLELQLPGDFTATGTAFLHNFLDMTDATATCIRGNDFDNIDPSTGRSCVARRVRGRSYGFELLIKRALTKRITGWISYTLSRSTRDTNPAPSGRGQPALEPSTVPAEFDRPHVLNVIGAYDLGSGWRIGGRFYFYSGRPYSRTYLDIPVPPYNSERLPPYYRIDVRLEKTWRVGKTGRISFVLEGLNVTLNKENVAVTCERSPVSAPRGDLRNIDLRAIPVAALDRCVAEQVGPIAVPSIGLEGAF